MSTPQPMPSGASTEAIAAASEYIAVNAALLRLFKGEYHDSVDRHSDSLFVRDHLESMFDRIAPLLARVAELEKQTAMDTVRFKEMQESGDRLTVQLAAAKGAVEELKNSTAHLRARKLEHEIYYRTCQIAEEKQVKRKINALDGQIEDNNTALTACAAVGLDGKEGK